MKDSYFIELELALLKPEVRQSKDELNRLIHDDFVEISQSGKMYGKEVVLASVPESETNYEAKDFSVRKISEDVVQVFYKTVSTDKDGAVKKALRSSLWKNEGDIWQMIFHQGTMTND